MSDPILTLREFALLVKELREAQDEARTNVYGAKGRASRARANTLEARVDLVTHKVLREPRPFDDRGNSTAGKLADRFKLPPPDNGHDPRES